MNAFVASSRSVSPLLRVLSFGALLSVLFGGAPGAPAAEANTNAAGWSGKSPWSDPNFFPLAVWLQSPANAARYQKAGINCYVGLWNGPTEEQLAALQKVGMRVICSQNEVGLKHGNDPLIIGWMHGDEPDNAQALPLGKSWGPPIPPETIVADYRKLRVEDPSRPVLLNLGQGVAWDAYYGRGVRSNHPEDYPRYIEGSDIVSFDIYPVVHEKPAVAGQLWFVPQGVERLVKWSGGRKRVWNCLECTHISNPDKKATPHQVRSMAWMSLIQGSQGIIYFVHQFKPTFREAALLDDPEMLEAVTVLNRQITDLAPVLRSPSLPSAVTVKCDNAAIPVATMVKAVGGATYLFAAAMREGTTGATFTLPENAAGEVEVLGESRTIEARNQEFTDRFGTWDVHLYRVKTRP